MPRAKKNAQPVEVKEVAKAVAEPVVEPVVEAPIEYPVKTRKPYPNHEVRIAMADAKITQLERLIEDRKALLERAESLAQQRRVSLEKTEQLLQAQVEKRVRILANKDKPAKEVGMRAVKAAEKAQLAEFAAALKASGKSIEDVIASLKK